MPPASICELTEGVGILRDGALEGVGDEGVVEAAGLFDGAAFGAGVAAAFFDGGGGGCLLDGEAAAFFGSGFAAGAAGFFAAGAFAVLAAAVFTGFAAAGFDGFAGFAPLGDGDGFAAGR